METSKIQGVETRKKAYSLKDFLNDCKKYPEKIMIDNGAKQSAKNSPLRLNGKLEILNFISQYKEQDFCYVNTREFENGYHGEHPPIDSYKINQKTWDLYIAFCILKTQSGWYIKSFHSDNTGETMSLGEMIFAKLLENKK